jgi:DNA-binding response OmpR family regulator
VRNDSRAHSLSWQNRRKALVVAEDSQARRHLREALSRAGYSADVSDDYRMIPKHQEAAGPSLLILDQVQAAIDAVRRLRQGGTNTPVILMSGGPDSGKPAINSSVPFVEHLSTPFTLKSLRFAICKVTQGHE